MKKLIILIFLFNISQLISQNKSSEAVIDSVFNSLSDVTSNKNRIIAYNKISLEYATLDSEKGLVYGTKALELSKKIDWKQGRSMALIAIGENNFCQGKYKEAFQNYESALLYTKDKNTVGIIYRKMAAVYTSQGDHTKASKYAFDALKISENEKFEEENAKNYNAIGVIYFYTNQPQKALTYFNRALKISTRLDLKREMCRSLQNIGSTYDGIFDTPNAIVNLNKSIALAEEINFKESLAINNFCLARLYVYNDDFENALSYVIKARKFAEEIKNNRIYNASLITEANIYTKKAQTIKEPEKTKLLQKAESRLLEAIIKSKRSNSLMNLSRCYRVISELYSLKKQDKIAKDYHVLYSEIKDSIYNSEIKETIKNLEDKNTIDLRNKEIQLNKITLQNKEKQKWYLVLGLLLLSIIGSLLFYQNQNRKKTNNKLTRLNADLDQANKAKTRFFSILNHDLRAPVSNLVFFLQLQKESPELLDEETTKRMQDKTMTSAENLLIAMEDILQWSKSQMENFKPQPTNCSISNIFADTKTHFSSEENFSISFENQQNIQIFTDENYLKTIIRNLTGNAIKALDKIENPTIDWKAWQEDSHTYLSITDNGSGASQEQFKALYDDKEVVGIKSGLGLHLIRDLAKAINCEIAVDSSTTGTTFTLYFK